jgi:secretion/DNA translocation related TadE-like protein
MVRSASERGSVSLVVLAALGMATVLAAFSADLSRVVTAKAKAQTAADAAALAAAQEIAVPSGEPPVDVAAEYARDNGTTLITCRCDPAGGEALVTVSLEVTLPLLDQTRIVQASARAVIASPAGADGLEPFFVARLACLFREVPGLWIVSGFRTRAEQAALFEQKPGLAAPPGSSNHERGLAADLGYPSDVAERHAHQQAAGCGLEFPISYEPWHVEPIGI